MSTRNECTIDVGRAHSTENVSRETIASQIMTLSMRSIEMFHVKHLGLVNNSDVMFGRTRVGECV